jgi:hypothetical protein
MAVNTYDVPIGPATVEFGATPTIFDITKGGIQFQATTNTQDVTVDQYGSAPVKVIVNGTSCQVTIPFALHDLDKLATVIPNATLITDSVDPQKKKIQVNSEAGTDLTASADKLVIKPTSADTTANDYVTIPLASPVTDPELVFDSENERIYNITFRGFPDTTGLLYVLGDESATV